RENLARTARCTTDCNLDLRTCHRSHAVQDRRYPTCAVGADKARLRHRVGARTAAHLEVVPGSCGRYAAGSQTCRSQTYGSARGQRRRSLIAGYAAMAFFTPVSCSLTQVSDLV